MHVYTNVASKYFFVFQAAPEIPTERSKDQVSHRPDEARAFVMVVPQ